MQYISTRGGIAPISFTQAVMMGLADDGGLLLPVAIPEISADTVAQWRGLSYPELAFAVLGASKVHIKHVLIFSYVFNFIGILIIGGIASL